ncbi:MAG: MATE family efflux transporter [Candidatus Cryptobacteroides sp.]
MAKKETSALFRLGLPIVGGQLGIIILSIADTMMVGRYGTGELAAASFVNSMFNLAIVTVTGFSYGITPVVGNHFGKGDRGSIGSTLKNALASNIALAAVFVAAMGILLPNISRLGQPEELLPLMRPYFTVLLCSLPFVMVFNAFKQFSDGITDTLTPMYILLVGNLFNILGNWLLIYGKAGMPEMGLLGAGVATLVSRILMVVCFGAIFLLSDRYAAYRDGFRQSRINRREFGELCRMGAPVALQMGMETASFSLSAIMVGWIGATALAAHQIMITVGQFGFMIYYGMAAAVAVRASAFCGQGDWGGVRKTVGSGLGIILAFAVTVAVIMLLFRHSIGMLFTDNVEVISAVAALVIPFALYQLGDGLQSNYANALRGISDVKMLTVYAAVAYFLISLPAGWVFGFVLDWGLTGFWLAFPLGLTSASLLYMRRFYCTLRRRTREQH